MYDADSQFDNSNALKSYSSVWSPSVLNIDIQYCLPSSPLSLHSNDLDLDYADKSFTEDEEYIDEQVLVKPNLNTSTEITPLNVNTSLLNQNQDNSGTQRVIAFENQANFSKSTPYESNGHKNDLYIRNKSTKWFYKQPKKSLSKEKRMILEKYFNENPYVNDELLTLLEKKINVTRNCIKRWFKDRRYRQKKKESTQYNTDDDSQSPPMTPEAVSTNSQENEGQSSKYLPMIKKTKEQINLLEDSFQKDNYVDQGAILKLKHKTKLPETVINSWFADRRKKEKKTKVVQNDDKISEHTQHSEFLHTQVQSQKKKKKTKHQIEKLEEAYNENKYIDEESASVLGRQINLSMKTVKEWFCRRRHKDKNKEPVENSKRNLSIYYRANGLTPPITLDC